MNTIHLDHKTMPEEIRQIFRLAFPEYRGRKFKMRGVSGPVSVRSYWDGGSRCYYTFVREDDNTLTAPTSSSFDNVTGVDSVTIPNGCVIVEHSIFYGKDSGLTLIVPAERIADLCPPKEILTTTEQTVLRLTQSLKSSYRRDRALEEGISMDVWAATVKDLAVRGLLKKNGAITPAGRNAAATNKGGAE